MLSSMEGSDENDAGDSASLVVLDGRGGERMESSSVETVDVGDAMDGDLGDGDLVGVGWREGERRTPSLAGLTATGELVVGVPVDLRDVDGMGFSPLTTEAKDSLFAVRGEGVESEGVNGEGMESDSLEGEAT